MIKNHFMFLLLPSWCIITVLPLSISLLFYPVLQMFLSFGEEKKVVSGMLCIFRPFLWSRAGTFFLQPAEDLFFFKEAIVLENLLRDCVCVLCLILRWAGVSFWHIKWPSQAGRSKAFLLSWAFVGHIFLSALLQRNITPYTYHIISICISICLLYVYRSWMDFWDMRL